ncbi:NapC/NirT family cytochrome c [Sedimenticola hydrogenitrophicus]|uniref:NapC/NirT family cytochrome c n=1 Tax=Sedimenticola hydrogenitrophicus TaxID=2967975 RepID=UPI0021A3A224|nr:NapC/NirT family cytochrome c [Sedimenticola hydrogenitrophicus]
MGFHKQSRRAREKLEQGLRDGKTCIDCHKGIAHKKPREDDWYAPEVGGDSHCRCLRCGSYHSPLLAYSSDYAALTRQLSLKP